MTRLWSQVRAVLVLLMISSSVGTVQPAEAQIGPLIRGLRAAVKKAPTTRIPPRPRVPRPRPGPRPQSPFPPRTGPPRAPLPPRNEVPVILRKSGPDWRDEAELFGEIVSDLPAVGGMRFQGDVAPAYAAIYPETPEAYSAMYGEAITQRASRTFERHAREATAAGATPITRGGGADLLDWIHTMPDRGPLFISGHSTNGGRVLHFPDGSRMDIEVLHATCQQVGSLCIVVTCYSPDLGLASTITPAEAVRSVEDGIRWAEGSGEKAGHQLGDAVIQQMLSSIRRRQARRSALQLVSFTAGGVGGAYVLIEEIRKKE